MCGWGASRNSSAASVRFISLESIVVLSSVPLICQHLLAHMRASMHASVQRACTRMRDLENTTRQAEVERIRDRLRHIRNHFLRLACIMHLHQKYMNQRVACRCAKRDTAVLSADELDEALCEAFDEVLPWYSANQTLQFRPIEPSNGMAGMDGWRADKWTG